MGKDYEPEVCVPKICCTWTVMPSRVLLKLVGLCMAAYTSHKAKGKTEPRNCAMYKDQLEHLSGSFLRNGSAHIQSIPLRPLD